MTLNEIEDRLQEEKELSYNEMISVIDTCIQEIKSIKSEIIKLTVDTNNQLKLLKGGK